MFDELTVCPVETGFEDGSQPELDNLCFNDLYFVFMSKNCECVVCVKELWMCGLCQRIVNVQFVSKNCECVVYVKELWMCGLCQRIVNVWIVSKNCEL